MLIGLIEPGSAEREVIIRSDYSAISTGSDSQMFMQPEFSTLAVDFGQVRKDIMASEVRCRR